MDEHVKIIYENSAEAKDKGILEQWRESFHENVACANFMKEQLNEHYKSNSLNTQAVLENTVEKFGVDRTKMILAHTIQEFSHDGRISRENKAWAEDIEVPRNAINYGHQYTIESSGMIDMVARKLQSIEEELVQKYEKAPEVEVVSEIPTLTPKTSDMIDDLRTFTSTDIQVMMAHDMGLDIKIREAVDYQAIQKLVKKPLSQDELDNIKGLANTFEMFENVGKKYSFAFIAQAINEGQVNVSLLDELPVKEFTSIYDKQDGELLGKMAEAYEKINNLRLAPSEQDLEAIQDCLLHEVDTEILEKINALATKTSIHAEVFDVDLTTHKDFFTEILCEEINDNLISLEDLDHLQPSDVYQSTQLDNQNPRLLQSSARQNRESEQAQAEPIASTVTIATDTITSEQLLEMMKDKASFSLVMREAIAIDELQGSLEGNLPFEQVKLVHDFSEEMLRSSYDIPQENINDFLCGAINEGEIAPSDLENIGKTQFFNALFDEDYSKLSTSELEVVSPIEYENQWFSENSHQVFRCDENLIASYMPTADMGVMFELMDNNLEVLHWKEYPFATIQEAINQSCEDMTFVGSEAIQNGTAEVVDYEKLKAEQNPLKTVELSTEENANMIDGIPNNLPLQEEPPEMPTFRQVNDFYTITDSQIIGEMEIALGESQSGETFGTWSRNIPADESKGVENWNFGHYFEGDKDKAMEDFQKRIDQHTPEKEKQAQKEKTEEKQQKKVEKEVKQKEKKSLFPNKKPKNQER